MVSPLNRIIAVLLCWFMLAPGCFAYTYGAPSGYSTTAAKQAAEILGIESQVNRLLALQREGVSSEETLALRSIILRKILRAVLEVRQACNKIDLELAYAYDILQRQERHEHFVYSMFNIVNFAQLSTLYTLEPYMRMQNQFVTSAVFTTTSGSLSIANSTLQKVYGRFAKASHVAPPPMLSNLVEGKPVDTSGMPPLVTKFMNSKSPKSEKSHKEELFKTWKVLYHVDPENNQTLCGICDRERASCNLLRTRVLLLWSMHTFVQDFDRDLLDLLHATRDTTLASANSSSELVGENSAEEVEAARLLKIEPQVNELISLKRSKTDSVRKDQLENFILQKTLEGAVDIQVASDKVDEELNYNYHVVLADLLQSRAKWLQYNYNMNFLQSGIMGVIAGRLYLSRWSLAGDRQFVISGGIGTGLTTLAILQMHGFWRKVDSPPNSLAQIFDLHPADEYRFSPLVSAFLNDPSPTAPGKTRLESLNYDWDKYNVANINLKKPKTRAALAEMPPHKYDTIKVVTARNVLLHSLKKELEGFQVQTLGLLDATDEANM